VETAERLRDRGWFPKVPDQAIVNNYEPGQGISMHKDRECFGPAIATISLGDRWTMNFKPLGPGAPCAMELDPGSLLLLTGPARARWMHGIEKRFDPARKRRASITFRTVPQHLLSA